MSCSLVHGSKQKFLIIDEVLAGEIAGEPALACVDRPERRRNRLTNEIEVCEEQSRLSTPDCSVTCCTAKAVSLGSVRRHFV